MRDISRQHMVPQWFKTFEAAAAIVCCVCAGLYVRMLANYGIVLRGLFLAGHPGLPLQHYSDAVQAAPDVQQAVVAVLLDRYLPLLAAMVASPPEQLEHRMKIVDPVVGLTQMLQSGSLQAALKQRMEQPGASVHLERAIALLAGMPADTSPAGTNRFATACMAVFLLCCTGSSSPAVLKSRAVAAWRFMESLPRLAATAASLLAEEVQAPCSLALQRYLLRLMVQSKAGIQALQGCLE